MTATVSEPPEMPAPVTVAVSSPAVSGANEKLDALSVSVAVGLPAAKVTVWERSDVSSQNWSWTMVTVATNSSVVAPVRVRVKTRSSIPAPILGWFGSMVTEVGGGPLTSR